MAFDNCSGKRVRDLIDHSCDLILILAADRAPVQRLLIAYTVDLIRVLRELFDITLRPGSNLATTWPDLKEAFETYEQSPSRRYIHESICSNTPRDGWMVTASDIRKKVRELLVK
jgi:hypothetical protein